MTNEELDSTLKGEDSGELLHDYAGIPAPGCCSTRLPVVREWKTFFGRARRIRCEANGRYQGPDNFGDGRLKSMNKADKVLHRRLDFDPTEPVELYRVVGVAKPFDGIDRAVMELIRPLYTYN